MLLLYYDNRYPYYLPFIVALRTIFTNNIIIILCSECVHKSQYFDRLEEGWKIALVISTKLLLLRYGNAKSYTFI